MLHQCMFGIQKLIISLSTVLQFRPAMLSGLNPMHMLHARAHGALLVEVFTHAVRPTSTREPKEAKAAKTERSSSAVTMCTAMKNVCQDNCRWCGMHMVTRNQANYSRPALVALPVD
jgi:hypothetical protein